MAYTAHLPGHGAAPATELIIRDDRGIPALQHTLPESLDHPDDADDLLREHGWVATAAWTMTEQGWAAPVAPLG